MTIDSTSVFKVKFTPDGAFIAGATSDRVFIWKVDDAYFPRATWNRPPGNGWQTPQSTESNGEDEHALSWDANGQKLAYGCNSVVCILYVIARLNTNGFYSWQLSILNVDLGMT